MNDPSRSWVLVMVCCLLVVSNGLLVRADSMSLDTRAHASAETAPLPRAVSLRAVDIVVVIDNSGSMGAEISSFQNEFTNHLVAPQIADGVATRVIVVSRHGDIASSSVCFEAPLSSVPSGGCSNPPTQPGITDIFKHYSVEIASLDAWCLLISTFDGATPDEFSLAPNGWGEWLREGALTVILMVTDAGVSCGPYDDQNSVAGGGAAATAIDASLLAMSPTHFGTASNRDYMVHSLVGLHPYSVPTDPWPPSSPITTGKCFSAGSAGTGHQGMSVLTNGLRFPVCSTSDYGTFLDHVSADITSRLPFFADGFEAGNADGWSLVIP